MSLPGFMMDGVMTDACVEGCENTNQSDRRLPLMKRKRVSPSWGSYEYVLYTLRVDFELKSNLTMKIEKEDEVGTRPRRVA
jgi:hypothetical protein